jgi:hypothetical protein
MTSTDLAALVRTMYILCEHELSLPFEIILNFVFKDVYEKGLVPSPSQSPTAISYDRVGNYLLEALEQAKAGNFIAARTLLQNIGGEILRCGIEGRLPSEGIE